ncbi:MAG: SPOR domain-containing protein, partial [Magnetococcales bacterium]|nr:SPOR domain-containing protein [Magnetococcales bacterium]
MVESSNGMDQAQQSGEEGQAEAVACAAVARGFSPNWRCLSGWGVALVVSLLSIPAWRDYWSPEHGALSVHGDLPSKPEPLPAQASASQERVGEAGAAAQTVMPPAGAGAALAALPPVIGAAQANEVSQSAPVPPQASKEEEGQKSPVMAAAESVEPVAPVHLASAFQVVDPALLAESETDLGVKKEEPDAALAVVPVEPEAAKAVVPVEPEAVKAVVPVEPEVVKAVVPVEPEAAPAVSPESATAGEAGQAGDTTQDTDGGGVTVPEVQPLRSAQAEKGLDSMYHAGRKAEPIPLDFHFALQVGSFQEREGALQRAGELRRKGYDAYVQESLDKRNGKQVWQSVR